MLQRALTKTFQRYWRMTRAVTLGAQVAVIDPQGRVLLVRHGYRPGWHFPGGGVDGGENVHAAVVRELEEETGLAATQSPRLFGIYSNFRAFPGDHIALFVLRDFERRRTPAPSREIAEHGFFAPSGLPEGTSAGTRARLREILDCAPQSVVWME